MGGFTCGKEAESFPHSLQNRPLSRRETFLQKLFIDHVKLFSVATFVAVEASFGGEVLLVHKVLSSHE